MSVKQCQQEVSSREFIEWMAYYRLEPFGELRSDLRNGITASVIANVNRDKKRKPKPFKAEDFMPDFAGQYDARVMSPEETLDIVTALHSTFLSMQDAGALDQGMPPVKT